MALKKSKMSIYIIDELKEYVDTQARNYGLSTSAYFTMIIQNQRMMSDGMASLNQVNETLEKLEKIQQLQQLGGKN